MATQLVQGMVLLHSSLHVRQQGDPGKFTASPLLHCSSLEARLTSPFNWASAQEICDLSNSTASSPHSMSIDHQICAQPASQHSACGYFGVSAIHV